MVSDFQHNRGQQTSPSAFCSESNNLHNALASLLGYDLYCWKQQEKGAGKCEPF